MLGECNCIEMSQKIFDRIMTTLPSKWEASSQYLINFKDCYYVATRFRIKKGNRHQTHIRVSIMKPDNGYLKRQKIVYYQGDKKTDWKVEALIAAGHTKEEIVAVEVAARLRGEG